MIRKSLLGLLSLLVLLAAVLAFNTWRQGSRQLDVPAIAKLQVDEGGSAQRLAEAVRLRTISSRDDANLNRDQFERLHALLQQRFPKLHAALKREVVGDLSLLFTWPGSKPEAAPIMLMAHQDVVPIAPGSEKDWREQPFSGELKDGFIWGRGAWDDKGNLMSQLEAVEALVASGFKPERTVYLSFGADEEVGGQRGAKQIAALLKSRGVHLDFILDEGLLITEGIMPGLKAPAALIGVAEKGYATLVLSTSAKPGHSSMPPAPGQSAIAMLSAALQRLEDRQFPTAIRGVAGEMFSTIAPEMNGFSRVALSNLWLFGPMVQKQLSASASTAAMLHTTTALTMLQAGNKENVLPARADATLNFRLLPGDSIASLTEHVKSESSQVLGGADKFELQVLPGAQEPSKVAPTDSAAYALLNRSVREVFPGTLVAPGLMIGGTDSILFGEVSDHIFKFSPVRAAPEDLPRFHGSNERLSVGNYADMIRFYHRLLSEGSKAQRS